jgi:CheY-like chemotaxis protein
VPTVALVEDNEDNRLVVQLLLSIRYEVRDCESDAEALAALAALAEATRCRTWCSPTSTCPE